VQVLVRLPGQGLLLARPLPLLPVARVLVQVQQRLEKVRAEET
jgi:hypothetical protein